MHRNVGMHRPTLSLVIAVFSNPPVELLLFSRFVIQSHSYIEIDTSVQDLPYLHPGDFVIIKPTKMVKMLELAKIKSLIDVKLL